MTADFAAIEGGRLNYLAGLNPWYIRFLPIIAVAIILLVWLATRRRLGTWSVGVAYLASSLLVMQILRIGVRDRLDFIPTDHWLEDSTLRQAELAIGARIAQSGSQSGREFIILKNPACHDRLLAWLAQPKTRP